MAPSTITRDTWTNDTGTAANPNGDGTILNNTVLQNNIYARIDAMFAGTGSYTTFELGGKLNVDGFGSHLFSAGGTGANSLRVRNTTSGTGNYGELALGNNSTATLGYLRAHSSAFTTSGQYMASGLLMESTGAGGLSLSASGANTIKFYVNSTLLTTADTTGWIWSATSGSTLHNFTVSGGGAVTLQVANSTNSAAATSTLVVTANGGNCNLAACPTTYVTSAPYYADGVTLINTAAGGLNLAASNASGAIRFFSGGGGSTLRGYFDSSGGFGAYGQINMGASQQTFLLAGSTSALLLNDTSNGTNAAALTIQQGTADDEILSLKSTDVAHGVTTYTETDTFCYLKKHDANAGGLDIAGFIETGVTPAVTILAVGTSTSTTNDASTDGTILLVAGKKSGTTFGDLGSTDNLLVVRNNATNAVIVDGSGDVYFNAVASTHDNTWDVYDDVALLSGLRGVMSGNEVFTRFIDYAKPVLERTGITKNGYASTKGLWGLTIDAIRQESQLTRAILAVLTDEQRAQIQASIQRPLIA